MLKDPYPLDLCKIKTDKELSELLPDPELRTTVAWYLMGKGYRVAMDDLSAKEPASTCEGCKYLIGSVCTVGPGNHCTRRAVDYYTEKE